MLQGKKIIAFIPARGGSKRFPGKNIYPLAGKPLISYAITAAKNSKYLDDVIVSTDSEEIAEVAKRCGASIPFLRPDEIASDTSPVLEALIYTLGKLEQERGKIDYVVLVQPTNPLIKKEYIDKAIELAIEKNADSVVSVVEVSTVNHPYNVRVINEDGTIKFWQEELHYQVWSKPKPKFYHAGNLWLSSRETIFNSRRLEGKNNYPLFIKEIDSLDIDYKEDLELIEAWMNYGK